MRVAPHCASGAKPQQLNDATSHAGCQFQDVIDRDAVVHYVAPLDLQLLEEPGKKATQILVCGPGGEGTGFESAGDLRVGSHDVERLTGSHRDDGYPQLIGEELQNVQCRSLFSG